MGGASPARGPFDRDVRRAVLADRPDRVVPADHDVAGGRAGEQRLHPRELSFAAELARAAPGADSTAPGPWGASHAWLACGTKRGVLQEEVHMRAGAAHFVDSGLTPQFFHVALGGGFGQPSYTMLVSTMMNCSKRLCQATRLLNLAAQSLLANRPSERARGGGVTSGKQ